MNICGEVYECIKTFRADFYDEANFIEEFDGFRVKKGSMWTICPVTENVTGAEIHLEELTGQSWLEVSERRLKSSFKRLDLL